MERIWTRGTGLLDTHVTWKDVQTSLEEHFKQNIEFGENTSIHDVTGGPENAFMSRVGLVNPDWKSENSKLPKKFVIKIFTILNSVSKQLSLGKEQEVHDEFEPKENDYFRFYHSEVLICQNIQKYLTEQDNFAVPHIYCIRPLSSENRGRGFILMEFIENDGGREVANTHIKEMLQVIVDIQLIGRRFSKEEQLELCAEPTASIWEFGSELGSDPIGLLKGVSDNKEFHNKLDQIEPYIERIKKIEMQNYLDSAADNIGIDRVLVHGDLHGGNVLWKKKGDDYGLKAVIDYQMSNFGSPAWDLVYFLLTLKISNENLRNWRQYTRMLYELHCEKEEPRYSYEQLIMERIWTRGTGLLDTHVTWKDVQTSLEEHFKQNIEFGENTSIHDVTGGPENAFMSRVGLVNPDWKSENSKLPKKFVIKIFTILNSVSKQLSLGKEQEVHDEFEPKENDYFRFYHSEVLICQNIQKYLTEQDNFAVPHIYCIRPLSSENRGRGFILMEFIENDGGREVANTHIKEMLQVIVDIQLIGRRFSKEEQLELCAEPTASIWEFGSELGSDPIGLLKGVSDNKEFHNKLDQIEPYIERIKKIEMQNYLDSAADNIGIDRVLVHGDLHGGNVLWKKKGDDYGLKAVIDYQMSNFGSPAWDLVYFLLTLKISNENLRNWRQYTRMLYELHCEKEEPRYSYEQLESCFVHTWPMWCILRAVWMKTDGLTPEQKDTVEYAVAFDRINTLLDQFLEFHPQNLKNYDEHLAKQYN